jgi:hypothetical protein
VKRFNSRNQGSGDTFVFSAELPPNVTASVRIPSDDASQVQDLSGRPPMDIAEFPGASARDDGLLGRAVCHRGAARVAYPPS